ncbi:MAG: hypothetical protein U0R78_00645 [Nocardioidaceae bacterium]
MFGGQARLLVIGSPADIAKSATRWAGDRRARWSAPSPSAMASQPVTGFDTFGVRTINRLDEVAEWVKTWDADMAVVVPGPRSGNSDMVRRPGTSGAPTPRSP